MLSTAIDRRATLGLLGAVALAPPAAAAGPLYLSARSDAGEGTFVAAFDAAGAAVWDVALQARGHAFAWSRASGHAVAFARRPGGFAVVLDATTGAVLKTIPAASGRHFNGHGVFAPAGELLYATEYAFDDQRGLVGVYDAAAGYARVAEFPSGGLDPHDLRLLDDGTTLVVANGGILTDPLMPGMKLNLPEMDPTLAYVDRRDGALAALHRLPPSLHQLSIRHLALGRGGTVAIAMQYEGPPDDPVPLVALHHGQGEIRPLAGREDVRRAMRQYCGSAAVDAAGAILGVTSPRGGIATFWDVASGALLSSAEVPDGCGIAPAPEAGRFLVTSGTGGAWSIDAATGEGRPLPSPALAASRWDNHVLRLGA